MKGNFKATTALALLTTTTVEEKHAAKFSESVAKEFGQIARSDLENAVRGILVGIGLHAVKETLPRGTFDQWKKKNLTRGQLWTESTALKNASFYMRLAIHVLEEVKPSKGELLALTASGQVTLALSYPEGNIRRLISRLTEHVGNKSLNELLIEHGIKDAVSGGGGGSSAPAPAAGAGEDPLLADTAEHLMGLRATLLDPDTVKRFTARQLDDIEKQWASGLDQFRKLRAKLRA